MSETSLPQGVSEIVTMVLPVYLCALEVLFTQISYATASLVMWIVQLETDVRPGLGGWFCHQELNLRHWRSLLLVGSLVTSHRAHVLREDCRGVSFVTWDCKSL